MIVFVRARTKKFGPSFWYLWAGQNISTFGNNLFDVALPWLIYNLTGSTWALAFAGICQTAPELAGIVSGALVDTWPKRRTMMWADALRALILIAVLLVPIRPLPAWLILGAIGSLRLIGTVFTPAQASILSTVVGSDDLTAASGLIQAGVGSARLLGAIVGGTIASLFGGVLTLLIDSLTFLLSLVSLSRLDLEEPPQASSTEGWIVMWAEGMGFILGNYRFLVLSMILVLVNFAFSPLDLALVVWLRDVLHVSGWVWGLLNGALMVGTILGGLTLRRVQLLVTGNQLLAACLLLGGLTLFSLIEGKSAVVTICCMLIYGCTVGWLNSYLVGSLLGRIPSDRRGRVWEMLGSILTMMTRLGSLPLDGLHTMRPLQR